MQRTPCGSPRTSTFATRWRLQRSMRSSSVGGAMVLPSRRRAFASRKIHGCSMARRPIITPAHPVESIARCASSADFTSPLTSTGMLTASRARIAHVQSAEPEWPMFAVRQWIVIAATPASSSRRARSTIGMCDSGPRPMRVLTVTGSDTLSTTIFAIATMAVGSRSHPAPAPRPAIFGTQHPQLMSMKSGSASSAKRAASARRSGSAP